MAWRECRGRSKVDKEEFGHFYCSYSQDDCQGLGVLRRLLAELACQSCQVTQGDCDDHDYYGDDHEEEDPDDGFFFMILMTKIVIILIVMIMT